MSGEIVLKKTAEVLKVQLLGELDHHTSEKVKKQWEDALQDPTIKHCLLNLHKLEFMDSSGLGVVLGRYKTITSRGGQMVICNVPKAVLKLLEMSGFYKIIQIEKSEQQAMNKLKEVSEWTTS